MSCSSRSGMAPLRARGGTGGFCRCIIKSGTTSACTKGGAPYVLVADGKIFQLTGHDAELRTHAGQTVVLTGELKGDTIRVATMEMPKPAK